MPLMAERSRLFWLVYASEDTVIYRLRMESRAMARLKLALDETGQCDKVDLFEYVSW